MFHVFCGVLNIRDENSPYLSIQRVYIYNTYINSTKKIEETSKEKHSLTRNFVGYRNCRQKKGREQGFGKRKVRQKSYIYSIFWFCYIYMHVLNIGFLSHISFPKTLISSFLHHFASNSYIPPTFSLENVFLYLLHTSIQLVKPSN